MSAYGPLHGLLAFSYDFVPEKWCGLLNSLAEPPTNLMPVQCCTSTLKSMTSRT